MRGNKEGLGFRCVHTYLENQIVETDMAFLPLEHDLLFNVSLISSFLPGFIPSHFPFFNVL